MSVVLAAASRGLVESVWSIMSHFLADCADSRCGEFSKLWITRFGGHEGRGPGVREAESGETTGEVASPLQDRRVIRSWAYIRHFERASGQVEGRATGREGRRAGRKRERVGWKASGQVEGRATGRAGRKGSGKEARAGGRAGRKGEAVGQSVRNRGRPRGPWPSRPLLARSGGRGRRVRGARVLRCTSCPAPGRRRDRSSRCTCRRTARCSQQPPRPACC